MIDSFTVNTVIIPAVRNTPKAAAVASDMAVAAGRLATLLQEHDTLVANIDRNEQNRASIGGTRRFIEARDLRLQAAELSRSAVALHEKLVMMNDIILKHHGIPTVDVSFKAPSVPPVPAGKPEPPVQRTPSHTYPTKLQNPDGSWPK